MPENVFLSVYCSQQRCRIQAAAQHLHLRAADGAVICRDSTCLWERPRVLCCWMYALMKLMSGYKHGHLFLRDGQTACLMLREQR